MSGNLFFKIYKNILVLVYTIFMIIYLHSVKECDRTLSDRDKTFRQVAIVVSYVTAIIVSVNTIVTISRIFKKNL